MRKFEIISKKQLEKDLNSSPNLDYYDTITLPTRSTEFSAGYDLRAVGDYILYPGDQILIPTGLKVQMEPDDVFLIIIRSGLGKRNLSLPNAVVVIDSDYYNNPTNEGHFWIGLKNDSSEVFTVHNGDRICQGIFTKYYKVDDDQVTNRRSGGFGSTGAN